MQTEIHRFDITDPTKTVYRATGTVPGFILNNYALSEHDGKLRVATTEEPIWAPGATRRARARSPCSTSRATGSCAIGSVTGLGKGERIYAVRFMGEQGYVVTFRQIDPLYTLDLRDPTAPKVVGELKIPGYSAYLHPVGEGRLLGIGRDGQRRPGLAVRRLQPGRAAARGAAAVRPGLDAGRERAARVPVLGAVQPGRDPAGELRRGAAFTGRGGGEDRRQRAERGRPLKHETAERGQVPIQRSFVIGDRLYTLSYLGVLSSNLADLSAVQYTAF